MGRRLKIFGTMRTTNEVSSGIPYNGISRNLTEFLRNLTAFFDYAGNKLRNSVKFREILLNTEFHNIRIPPGIDFRRNNEH